MDNWLYSPTVGAITIFITGRGPLSGSFFVPKKSTSMKSSNSMPAENSTVCECSFSNQKHRLNHSSSFYKDGPLVINAVWGPYKWPKINGFHWLIFHPCKWSKWRFQTRSFHVSEPVKAADFSWHARVLGQENNTWKAAWSRVLGTQKSHQFCPGWLLKKNQ